MTSKNHQTKDIFSSEISLLDQSVLSSVIRGLALSSNKLLPTEIIALCCNFHAISFESIYDFRSKEEYDDRDFIFDDAMDHTFEHLRFPQQTLIVGRQQMMKLSVAYDLNLFTEAIITSEYEGNGGIIILVVGKTIHLRDFASISTSNTGHIYIQCHELILDRYSCIETREFGSEQLIVGTIHINAKTISLEYNSFVLAESVKIQCDVLTMADNSEINALRGDLEINAKEIW
eukprot:143368_1